LLVSMSSLIDAAIPGRGQDHLTVGKELRRLGTRFPPHDVLLDRVELGEGTIDTLGRRQHIIDVLDIDAVSDQSPFEIEKRTILQAALAGIFLRVEEGAD